MPKAHIQYLILNVANLSHSEIAKVMNKSVASVKNYFNLIAAEFDIKIRSEIVYYCTTHGIVKHPNYYANKAKTGRELK
jgi:DNA-binding CsgD family transcriptional regulator